MSNSKLLPQGQGHVLLLKVENKWQVSPNGDALSTPTGGKTSNMKTHTHTCTHDSHTASSCHSALPVPSPPSSGLKAKGEAAGQTDGTEGKVPPTLPPAGP